MTWWGVLLLWIGTIATAAYVHVLTVKFIEHVRDIKRFDSRVQRLEMKEIERNVRELETLEYREAHGD